MKPKLLAAAIFIVGIFSARAQSNPSSTNGVDTEVELPWPNGDVYYSSYVAQDYYSATNLSFEPTMAENDNYNWSEMGGGNGYYATAYPDDPYDSYTNKYTWPGTNWPNIALGEEISFQGSINTNYEAPPPVGGGTSYQVNFVDYGSANFNDFADGGEQNFQGNDYPQITLVTGGAPGTTGSELFGVAATAQNVYPDGYNIPLQQTRVPTFGAMDPNGWAFAVLPLHQQFPITVSASDGYYQFYEGVQPFQLVIQCVSSIPANQARTTVGVGEQVNLSFSPTLPTNAIWSTTAGSLSYTTNTFTQFTAPATAGIVTVTATVEGKPLPIPFNVVAPKGMVTATIIGTNSYSEGILGAGMTNEVWLQPTNVSFYRVYLIELQCAATNITGYFTSMSIPPPIIGSGQVAQDNDFVDVVGAFYLEYNYPLYPGSYEFDTPVEWKVTGSSQTNSLGIFTNTCSLLDSSGDFSDSKYGITITRSLDDVSHSSQ